MRYLKLLLLICSFSLHAKILIMTHSYNRPDFIEIQATTFRAFLQDDYEFVVFNDAPHEHMKEQIERTCQRLGIKCIRFPQHTHTNNQPGQRHIDGIMFALRNIGYDYKGIVTLIDSDMFLIRPFSIEKYLHNYDISGELQGRGNSTVAVGYLSPVLVFMNMQTLPNRHTINFDGGRVEGLACDVGGHTYYYLRDNPSVRLKNFGALHIGTMKYGIQCHVCNNMTCSSCVQTLVDNKFNAQVIKFIQECPENIEFFLNHNFFHYRGGSNWDNKPGSYHDQKTRAFNNFLNAILNTADHKQYLRP